MAAVEDTATESKKGKGAATRGGAAGDAATAEPLSPSGLTAREQEADATLAAEVETDASAATATGRGRTSIASPKGKVTSKGGKAEEVLVAGQREARPVPKGTVPDPKVSCALAAICSRRPEEPSTQAAFDHPSGWEVAPGAPRLCC